MADILSDNTDNYQYQYRGVPTMTSALTHAYLREAGRRWTGRGVAMELGSYMGSSAISLLEGLKQAGYDHSFWAFDRWVANAQQVELAGRHGITLELGQDVRPLFLRNVCQVYEPVRAVKGSLPGTLDQYEQERIEICIFDAPKQEPVFTDCIKALYGHWIPGVTVLGLLDYNFYARHSAAKRKKFMAPVDFMREHGNCFRVLWRRTGESAVFFRYIKKLKLQ